MLDQQKKFLRSGAARAVSFRRRQLQTLYRAIKEQEPAITAALSADLGKSAGESYATEIGMVLSEIRHTLRHLEQWCRPQRAASSVAQLPARSYLLQEPLGVCLIIAPWNYPFQLAMLPLVSAIAAGNCVTLKPSELAPHTAAVLEQLLKSCFPPYYCHVVQGGAEAAQQELAKPYDLIFFTGSERVGRLVMEAAAKHLTPVILELGGKSPCIVDATADLRLAARRILWGKLLNAGQTCIAPDYLLVHSSIREQLIDALRRECTRLYSADPLTNPAYPRILHRGHFDRLMGLIQPELVRFGGSCDPDTLRIAPTLIDCPSPDSPIMQEEIFGPLLPLLTFDHLQQAMDFILDRPKPLALYLFSNCKAVQRRVTEELSFGGGCINDTISHIVSHTLPFGGVGTSGMGSYHGIHGFRAFSHTKPIVHKALHPDLPMRYPPFDRYLPILHRILK